MLAFKAVEASLHEI